MTETTSPPAKPGRGLKIALALSLALNLAIAGLVAGHGSRTMGRAVTAAARPVTSPSAP